MIANLEPKSEAAADTPALESYAQILRIIAAALEKLQVESFDVEIKDGVYHVHGHAKTATTHTNSVPDGAGGLMGAWRRLRNRFFAPPAGAPFELHYTPANLRELELASHAQRGNALRYPDAQSLTETLRAAGAFLDNKSAYLFRLAMRGRWITLHYKTSQGHLVVEEHTATSLYGFWRTLCAQRTTTIRPFRLPKAPKHIRVDPEESD